MVRVLVVEDEPVYREVMMFLLEDAGLASEAAGNGQEAVEMARRGAYALILIEMPMSVTTGLGLAIEAKELSCIGMPHAIRMRHRLTHFSHLFAGGAYSARYYVYPWAEVLDADGFDAFPEAGSHFDAATAERL